MERRDPPAGVFFRKPPPRPGAPAAPPDAAPAAVAVPPPAAPPAPTVPPPLPPPPPPVVPEPPRAAPREPGPPPLPPEPPGVVRPAAEPAGRRESRRLFFHGTGGGLFRIHIVNAFFTLLTLGVYYFWGKAEVRRYLMSQTEIEGDRFAYHGTGGELFAGFVKAVLLFWLPFVVAGILLTALADPDTAQAALVAVGWLVSLIFVPYAVVSARRYRLSRTSWRGIRFSFRGQAGPFIRLFAGGSLLTIVTLGLYYPFFDTRRQAFLVGHSWFGNRRFGFDADARELFGPFLLSLVLTLPTLGLCWFWYVARKRRLWWAGTSFEGGRFRSTVTGGALLGLVLGNLLILLLTLGLGRAWATVRTARFGCRMLHLDGALDVTRIEQDARAAATTGEGLAGILDVGGGLDLG